MTAVQLHRLHRPSLLHPPSHLHRRLSQLRRLHCLLGPRVDLLVTTWGVQHSLATTRGVHCSLGVAWQGNAAGHLDCGHRQLALWSL